MAYSHFPRLTRFLRKHVGFQGAESLQEALKGGKGVILVTGHFGAVEFLPGCLALNDYPATMICRFQTDRLRESMSQRAQWVDLDLIDADGGNVFLAAFKALKQGRILITECDEFDEWRTDHRRDTYFMGYRFSGDRTLDVLQKRSGAPVVTALLQRNGGREYTLHLTPVSGPSQTVARQCLGVLEDTIQAHPAQWYQWKKFGKMIEPHLEVKDDRQTSGYLAPEIGLSVPDQA